MQRLLNRIDSRLEALKTGEPFIEPKMPLGKKLTMAFGLVVVLGVIGLVVWGIVSVVSEGSDSDDDSSSGGGRDEIMAGVMCEQFIEQRLVSPSSADFQNFAEYVVTGAGNEYPVSGFVDADNRFGASLRSNWTCSVTYNEAADNWTLTALTGLG